MTLLLNRPDGDGIFHSEVGGEEVTRLEFDPLAKPALPVSLEPSED